MRKNSWPAGVYKMLTDRKSRSFSDPYFKQSFANHLPLLSRDLISLALKEG